MEDIKLTIDGKEYTWEEAQELYEKLDKLFGNNEPVIMYRNPFWEGESWSSGTITIT